MFVSGDANPFLLGDDGLPIVLLSEGSQQVIPDERSELVLSSGGGSVSCLVMFAVALGKGSSGVGSARCAGGSSEAVLADSSDRHRTA
jgi:hypothetical protein